MLAVCTRYSVASARAFAFVRRPIFPLPTHTHTHTHTHIVLYHPYVPIVCANAEQRSVLCVDPSTTDQLLAVYMFYIHIFQTFHTTLPIYVLYAHISTSRKGFGELLRRSLWRYVCICI